MPARGEKKNMRYLSGILAAGFAAFILAACSAPKPIQEDPFVEKWLELAEISRGDSPEIRERKMVDIDDLIPFELEPIKVPEPERILPREKVTLRLREAPVPVVLRVMSRAADQNILISENVTGTMNVDIKDVPWDQAFLGILRAQGLDYAWVGDIIRIKSIDDLQHDLNMFTLREEIRRQELAADQTLPLRHSIIRVNYADPEKLSDNLNRVLTRDADGEPRGYVAVDQETNSLVVKASQIDLERVKKMIDYLDQPRSQILIEANIVEATQTTARELGTRWSGRYVTPREFLDEVGIGEPLDDRQGYTGDLILEVVSGRLPGSVLYAQLQALQRQGKLNILSSPSITTMDNQMAFTEHGERVPFETIDADGDRRVEFQDAVLRLEVIPSIIDDEHMKMQIRVKKDEVDFSREVRGNPLIRIKETETNLVVRDGETIVISGLSKQTVSDSVQGIPGLKELPGLGWFFKGKQEKEDMEEFLIFITPTILGAMGYETSRP